MRPQEPGQWLWLGFLFILMEFFQGVATKEPKSLHVDGCVNSSSGRVAARRKRREDTKLKWL